MDIRGKVCNTGGDARVQTSPECKMASKAHSCGPDQASASRQAKEVIYRVVRVFIVRLKCLLDFPLIALIRSRYVVGQRLRPREVMIATWSRYNVSLTSDLPSEPCHRTGDLVNLAEDYYSREAARKQISQV